jgi:hypothetical protein
VGLYALGCALPVIHDRDGPLPGWACLLLCWRPPLCLPWSANLFLAAGLLCLGRGRYRMAAGLGTASALLGLTTWAFVNRNVGIGYYLWQASPILLAVGAHGLWSGTGSPPRRRTTTPEGVSQLFNPQEDRSGGARFGASRRFFPRFSIFLLVSANRSRYHPPCSAA